MTQTINFDKAPEKNQLKLANQLYQIKQKKSDNVHFSGVMALLRLYCTNLNRRFYIFATLIHPASYLGLIRYLVVWPNHLRKTPKHIEQLILQLLNESGYQVKEEEGKPHIIDTGWELIEEQKRINHNQPKPALDFFVQHNPHYLQGKGLVVITWVRPIHVAHGVYKMIKFKFWDRNQTVKKSLNRMILISKSSQA